MSTDLRCPLPASAEVLIVGAGVAGASLHLQLALRGVNSLLIERGAVASGASSIPAALLNPYRGRSARARTADMIGLAAFWRSVRLLEAEGVKSGAYRSGVLRIADSPRQARAWQRLTELPPTAPPGASAAISWLEPSDVAADYHAPFGALLVEAGGWVTPRHYLAAMVRVAAVHSGEAAYGVELSALQPRRPGGLTASVLTSRGEQRIAARLAVLCLGASRPAAVAQPQFEFTAGEAFELEMTSTPPYPLAGGVVAAFKGNRAFVSGGHRPVAGAAAAAATREQLDALQRTLSWQLPAAGSAARLGSWHGVRVRRPSGEPVARRLCTDVYYFGALGGRGFLRSASLAERLADQLLAQLTV